LQSCDTLTEPLSMHVYRGKSLAWNYITVISVRVKEEALLCQPDATEIKIYVKYLQSVKVTSVRNMIPFVLARKESNVSLFITGAGIAQSV
jgi:hypothetical protein